MAVIMSALEDSFDVSRVEQHSVETTPNDLTVEKVEAMVALGVDRVSVGVQSFDAHQGDDLR